MLSKNKRMLYERQADILQAIGHPLRIAITDFLKDGERCVCNIAEHIGSERSNVSRHLAILVNAGLLDSRKQGLNVIYSLKCHCVLDFLSCATKCLKLQVTADNKLINVL